jgi:hypothetical protein
MAWASDSLRKSGLVITERLLNLGRFEVLNLRRPTPSKCAFSKSTPSLDRHGSQTVQRGEAGLAVCIEQHRNALALFLIKRGNKT